PGTYREIVRIWPGMPAEFVLRGETGDASDVVLTYDLAAGTEKFYGGEFGRTGAATLAILAADVTICDLTIENAYDEEVHGGSQAQALRTVGDRITLDGVRLLGNQDTFLAETPGRGIASRVYARDSSIEGDVDFIYGSATTSRAMWTSSTAAPPWSSRIPRSGPSIAAARVPTATSARRARRAAPTASSSPDAPSPPMPPPGACSSDGPGIPAAIPTSRRPRWSGTRTSRITSGLPHGPTWVAGP